MIPVARLAPRRNRRQPPLSQGGLENASPFLMNSVVNNGSTSSGESSAPLAAAQPDISPLMPLHKGVDSAPQSPIPTPLQHHDPETYQRRVLSNKGSYDNVDASRTAFVIKSPNPGSEATSDASISDCSLTPPVTGPRPLVVSAKRLGHDVRRKHSKRRKCRSRRGRAKDDNGFCLWRDANPDGVAPNYGSSDDEDHDARQGLPFLFTKQEVSPDDRNRHYWEWCYGKGKTIDLSDLQGWSATRAPPLKSWPQKKISPNARFRTPPVSPKEMDVLNQSAGSKKGFRVQFGSPKAAEYEIDEPSRQLTPLPSHVTRQRFSMDQKKASQAEEEITEETKQNSAVLAEWEEKFEEPKSTSRRRRKKNRRSSSLFTPSPMLVDKGDHNEEIMTPPCTDMVVTVPSPSIVVAEDLASLRMESPAKNPGLQMISGMSSTTAVRPEVVRTIHSTAAEPDAFRNRACATDASPQNFGPCGTPQRHVSSRTQTAVMSHPDLTPPQANAGLASIHSLGGALDNDSPMGSSPSSSAMMVRACENNDEQTRANQASFEAAKPAEHIDIIDALLKAPSLDQEWEPADIFRSLSRKTRRFGLERLFKFIDIRHDGVRAWVDDLVETVKHRANSKKRLSISENSKNSGSLILREWRDIETKFLIELSTTLGRCAKEAISLSTEVDDKKGWLATSVSKRVRCASLRREIDGLKERIRRERNLLEANEATAAPYAAVSCLASSHVGLYGFRMEECTGSSLRLSFDHAVGGIESKYQFNLQDASVAVSVEDKEDDKANSATSIGLRARDVQRYFLKRFSDDPHFLSDGLGQLDLHDQILTLSTWLGRLDAATLDLVNAAANADVDIDLPIVTLSFRNGAVLKVAYENQCVTKPFAPSKVTTSGNQHNVKLPCKIQATDFLQQIVALCSVDTVS